MPEHLISRERAEDDLLACAAYIAERINSADGQAEAISAVVPHYLAAGDADAAAELANVVEDSFTRDRLLTRVAEKCAETGDGDYALQLAEAVEDDGLRTQALEAVAIREAAAGNIGHAIAISKKIEHPDYVFAAAAAWQASSGDREAAEKSLSKIEYPSAAVAAHIEMAGANGKGGSSREADAESHLNLAAEIAGTIEHVEERTRALIEIGELLLASAQNTRAAGVFELAKRSAEAIDNMHRDQMLGTTALGFLRSGSLELADRTLDLIEDKTQISSCLLGYAREFSKRGDELEAIDALEESYAVVRSQRDGETRNSLMRLRLIASIAAQFAGFGKGERAIEIAQSIPDETESTAALVHIAEVLERRGETEMARAAVAAIADDADRAAALVKMSDAARERKDADGSAASFLNEAAELAETVQRLPARAAVYCEIAGRFAKFGDSARAAEVAQLTLADIAAIRDPSVRAVALVHLAEIDKSADLGLAKYAKPLFARLTAV